jgi:hypothetical protein
MLKDHDQEGAGWFLRGSIALVVFSFMVLSLAVTATGTARFAIAMGYSETTGYAVGTVFDIAKAMLPVALLILVRRRAFTSFATLGVAWLGLVTYSALATHSTVSTAIVAIERTGTWKMEGRTNTKAELTAIEQRLAALSEPKIPRPSGALRQALAAEKIPPDVWRNSQECLRIRDDRYFQKACAKVLDLRRELAASEAYEQLESRARGLRQDLAAAPIVATSDPLPEAFAATIGRLVPLDGRVGVALLFTLVIEIMSCFGFAGLRALRTPAAGREARREAEAVLPQALESGMVEAGGEGSVTTRKRLPDRSSQVLPDSSLKPVIRVPSTACAKTVKLKKSSSNVLPLPMRAVKSKRGEGPSLNHAVASGAVLPFAVASHVLAFASDRLLQVAGESLAASELRAAYEAWCKANNHEPLSQQKLSAELLRLGYSKWKSCGLIRYRDLHLAA